MKQKIIEFIKHVFAFILIFVSMLALFCLVMAGMEEDHMNDMMYGQETTCIRFDTLEDTDEFGEKFIDKKFYYSDGTMIEEIDYIDVECVDMIIER